jgi:hypothetical protein
MTSPTNSPLVRGVAFVLMIAGGFLLLDAVVALAWQEPLTAVIARAGRRGAVPGLDPQLLTDVRGWAVRLRDHARGRTR